MRRQHHGVEVKDMKPTHRREASPSRVRADRPDNGSDSRSGHGPSSDARKDNPHSRLKLSSHARCALSV